MLILLFFVDFQPPAWGISIILNFNAGSSESPAFDPVLAGNQPPAGLRRMFEFAEQFYEDVFEDSHTLTINYWYEDLSGTTIGLHSLVSQSGTPNRETEANIRIDTRVGTGGSLRNWFIDPTPATDNEFTMQQTLWRDLTATQRTNFYNAGANIPATFEAGFTGNAIAGSAAAGNLDMLSTVLHEVGHALGMSAANNATVAQTGDGDYDFNSAFVFGRSLAARTASATNIAHLADTFSLMFPSATTGVRARPSHTDLFSMASGHVYAQLDVPRREFYGGSNWNSGGNWSGNQPPGIFDDAFVRNPGSIVTANLSAAAFAANLTVSEGGNVNTQAFRLLVDGTVTISDIDSDIFVSTGGELDAITILVTNNAELNVNGGLVDTNFLTLTQGTTLTFLQGTGGTIDVQNRLNNNATIRANSGGTLTFFSSGGAVWDLDGTTGGGIVQAVNGNLDFASGSLTDAFDGRMDVGNGSVFRTLNIAQPWILGSGGVINMSGGAAVADRSQLSGGTITANAGVVNANAGINRVTAPISLGGSFTANVANGAQLQFNGATTLSGGSFNNNGTGQTSFNAATTYNGGTINSTGLISQVGNATVTAATTLNGDVFNFDGNGPTSWTLNSGLTLNVNQIDNVGSAFDGTLNINGITGNLTVNTPSVWTLAGQTNIASGTTLTFPSISGQDFNLIGTVNITGGTRFDARVNMSGTVNLQNGTSRLAVLGGDLANPNVLSGATISGPAGSSFRSTSGHAAVGFGTINTSIDFLTGSELLAHNGTLTVNGPFISLGVIGTHSATGTLNVVNAWNTNSATELRMNGGIVTGGSITNDGAIRGFGTITSANLTNNGSLSADGGVLTLNTALFPDIDGSGAETGVLNAVNGNLHILGDPGFEYNFNATINIGPGRSLVANNLQLFHGTSANTNLTQGLLQLSGFGQANGGQLTTQGGESRIVAGANNIRFLPGSTTTLNGDLRLVGSAEVLAGASFNGGASLIVDATSQLKLQTAANVAVGVINQGLMEVGLSPGVAQVGSWTQTASGRMIAEIDGTAAGIQYDQLNVSNNAALAGRLDIVVNQNGGVYTDPVGSGMADVFTLVNAAAMMGNFAQITYDSQVMVPTFFIGPNSSFNTYIGDNLFRIADYATGTDFRLINYAALPGDANGDGTVDGIDFIIWNNNKFSSGADWTQGDFNGDGTVDGSDFIFWNANKFTSIAFSTPSLRMVPEPHFFLLLPIAFVTILRGRREER